MSDVGRGHPVRRRHRLRGVRRRRLRRRVLGPDRRRRRARGATARGDRPLDRPGVGGEPRLADLLPRRALDGFSEAFASITLTLFVPLTLAALGIVLRGSSFAFRKAVTRTSSTSGTSARRSRSSSVLVPYCMGAVAGAIASGRVPAGGKAGDPWSAGSTRPRSSAACSRSSWRAYLAVGVPGVGRPPARRTTTWSSTSAAAPWCAAVVAGRRRLRRDLRAPRRRAATSSTGSRRGPLPARDPLGAVRHRLARAAATTRQPPARAARDRRGRDGRARLGCRAVALHAADEPDRRPGGGAVGHAHRGARRDGARGRAPRPSFVLLYVLDQRSLLPAEGATDQASAGS